MIVDIIFGALGLTALFVAFASLRAGAKSEIELEKIIREHKKEMHNESKTK